MTTSPDQPNGASLPPEELRLGLELELPSDVRYIQRIVELVRCQCEQMCFSQRHCSLNVPVALTEALSNAILRGNLEDPDKRVRVRLEIDNERLVVDIADEGPGFDLQQSLRDPTRPENLMREDGRGLFLMSRLMHRVERLNLRGNVVRMTLRRDE